MIEISPRRHKGAKKNIYRVMWPIGHSAGAPKAQAAGGRPQGRQRGNIQWVCASIREKTVSEQ